MTGYWKFLVSGGRSPFVGFDWRAAGDGWVDGVHADVLDDAAVAGCRAGVHACRIEHLPYWLNDELWSVELDEPRELAHKVVAPRARLRSRVEAWTPTVQHELALACVLRTAGHAADELHDVGTRSVDRLAEVVAGAGPGDVDLVELRSAAQAGADAAEALDARPAHGLVMLAVDAIDYVDECPVATLAYIAARAADARSRVTTEDPSGAERAWQSAWLAERLGLTH